MPMLTVLGYIVFKAVMFQYGLPTDGMLMAHVEIEHTLIIDINY
jgi:hypothetical protein